MTKIKIPKQDLIVTLIFFGLLFVMPKELREVVFAVFLIFLYWAYQKNSWHTRMWSKWITIDITIMTPYTELVKAKSLIEPYAKELGWVISSGNWKSKISYPHAPGIQKVNLTLSPKSGHISPIKLLEDKDKIYGISFAIYRDLVYGGNHEEALKNAAHRVGIRRNPITSLETGFFGGITATPDLKNKVDWFRFCHEYCFLSYNYKLVDRLDFEVKNKEVALKLFGSTLEADVKKIFTEDAELFNKASNQEKKIKKTKESKLTKEKKPDKNFNDLEESNNAMKQEIRELFGFKF